MFSHQYMDGIHVLCHSGSHWCCVSVRHSSHLEGRQRDELEARMFFGLFFWQITLVFAAQIKTGRKKSNMLSRLLKQI